jgi:hypothetical protein
MNHYATPDRSHGGAIAMKFVLSPAIICLPLALLVALPCAGAEYYLSPDGDDAAPGTQEQPWLTIEKANATLEAGDTAIFLPGEYEGTISPARSGTADAPISYRSETPRQARLHKTGANDKLILLNGRDHLVIDGFYLDGGGGSWQEVAGERVFTMDIATGASWLFASGCRDLTIRNCEMRDSATSFYSFEISRSSQVRVLDNLFSRDNPRPVDMVHFINCDRVLFEGNSTMHAGHSTLTVSDSNYVVIRGNVLHNEWGRNHIIWHSARVLFEGNILTRARDSAGSAGSQSQTTHDDSIIRHNRFYDNLGTTIEFDGRIYSDLSPTGRFHEPFWVRNNRIYHNTFTGNPDYCLSLRAYSSANVFQNNILYRNDWDGGNIQVLRRDGEDAGNRFLSNLISGTGPGQAVVMSRGSFWTAAEADANTPTWGGFWSEFRASLDADPRFVAPERRDYRLSAESPALDAGTPLALAIGAGTGRELPVNDGYPFYDGFGIGGEQGDLIAVGRGDNLARVERVELRYFQNAILHLDREVTWTDGMPVSLPWTGAAPDLGSFEQAAPGRLVALLDRATAAAGEEIRFSVDSRGDMSAVTWHFDDGVRAEGREVTRSWDEPGGHAVSVRATLPDGRRAMDVAFVRILAARGPDAPLVSADFENESYRRDWGYLFKCYNVWQTGAERVPSPDRDGLCMRLFRHPDRTNGTAAQLVPGEWDIDRYPLLRFAYRIPPGVPVAVEANTFRTGLRFTTHPDRPIGFVLGGTQQRVARHEDLDAFTLIDDGQWHEVTVDVRVAREAYPDLRYLRQSMFFLYWTEDHGQEMWFDDFAILPE